MIKWKNKLCNETFGPTVYQVSVMEKSSPNLTKVQTDFVTSYSFSDLKPFVQYNVLIRVSRGLEAVDSTTLTYNFTTLSASRYHNCNVLPFLYLLIVAVASAVEDLDLYAADRASVSLRYRLPQMKRGIPRYVQVEYNHPLFISGSHVEIENITTCVIWPDHYCVYIDDLLPESMFTFAVSIKNKDTPAFGEERVVVGSTVERGR